MQEAVADGVGDGRLAEVVVPLGGRELARDDGRAGAVAVLQDFQEVAALLVLDRGEAPVIDDWGLAPVKDQERRDLLEVMEDRYGTRSTIMTSQLPTSKWHDYLVDPTMADAICDRPLHNAHRLALKGPARRKEDSATDK